MRRLSRTFLSHMPVEETKKISGEHKSHNNNNNNNVKKIKHGHKAWKCLVKCEREMADEGSECEGTRRHDSRKQLIDLFSL